MSIAFYDRELRPWPNPRLNSASIVGHTTTSSVRLWFRVLVPGDYVLIVAKQPLQPEIAKKSLTIRRAGNTFKATASGQQVDEIVHEMKMVYDTDLTMVVDLQKLDAGTRYYYAVKRLRTRAAPVAWDWELGYEVPLSFETQPDDLAEVNFGIYSCHMPYDGRNLVNMEMWDNFYSELQDARARFVLGTGDQVYVDGNDSLDIWRWLSKVKDEDPNKAHMLSWYRDIYRGYWGMVPIQRVFRGFANYMIWDDHEIMDGWGSYSDEELSDQLDTWWEWENKEKNLELARRMFAAAEHAYMEYEHSHNPPTPAGQWDYSFRCGPASFYALDMRGQRNYEGNPGERILGPEQMKRFAKWIDEDEAKVLFVISPVPVLYTQSFILNWLDVPFSTLKDDVRDHWEHPRHRAERDNLLQRIFKVSHETKRRVIIISGDVHVAAASKLYHPDWPDAKVYQVTSSGITYAGLSDFMRAAIKLMIRDQGELALDEPEDQGEPAPDEPDKTGAGGKRPYRFTTLHVLGRNNFGIFRVSPDASGGVSVRYDLYGKSHVPDAILRLKRIEL